MSWPTQRAIVLSVLAACVASCTALLGIDGDYRAESDGGAAADGTTEAGQGGKDAPATGSDAGPAADGGGLDAPSFPANPGPVTGVTAGRFHTCIRFQTGFAMCFGRADDYGELGNGSVVDTSVPLPAMGSGIAKLVAGAHDTCAILADGSVCAGKGGRGELLDDVADADSPVPVPETVLPAATVSIASGDAFTCAVVQGGDVYCAGAGASGVLGNGGTTDSLTAVKASLPKGATSIAAFSAHACALLVDGTVACWGDDSSGQLGDGNSGSGVVSATPVAVQGLPGPASSVCVGDDFSCALLNDTTVWCWGDDGEGQLGHGDTSLPLSATAVEVNGSKGAASITCGAGHACLGNDNDKAGIWCWGSGGSGQLGNGDTHDQYTPVAVSGVSAYPFSLAAGGFHTCAVLSSPNVQCWGANDFGQLGDDQVDASYTPVSAVGIP